MFNITQYDRVALLGQRSNPTVNFPNMLRPKCLFVIKGLRKEGHGQKHVDLLFKSIVLVLARLTFLLWIAF